MLTMNDVSYSYKGKRTQKLILDRINITFEPGKVYAIYGSSGSGKTTCLSLLGGLEHPCSGTITLDDQSLKEIGYDNVRKHFVSYVFQDYHLFKFMTGFENVALAASIIHTAVTKEAITKLLESLGIDAKTMHRPVSQISGGQQQRVAIARALVCNPSYILADEPTGNLDKENTALIMDVLTALAHERNKCVIIATHSEYVKKRADVAIELEYGILK